VKTVSAAYPAPVAANLDAQAFLHGDEHWNWWNAYRTKVKASEDLQNGIDGYYTAIMREVLPAEEENTVCSPINIYIAFAMLAEVSDGNTRQQVLDMLGAPDIETLRSNVSALWESNYADTPVLKSLLANSLWLNGKYRYHDETLARLSEQYYASSFCGTPGSPEMDEALQEWTDKHTGGLLHEYVKEMKLDPATVLEIVSTIYYKAQWTELFLPGNTTQEVFHGTTGDTTVDMMHRTDMLGVYRTDTFTSVGLNLFDSGSMYFFLPKEGVDVNALAADPELLAATRYSEDNVKWSSPLVRLSVPKFQASSRTDLLEIIQLLGLTDALDPAFADFTPLTTDRDDLYLSAAEHAAKVEIDEQGVTGAAYTALDMATGAAEPDDEIDFVLDRPFLFLITGRDGSVLFSGIIRNIG
jgi:serine protease inhibitor